VRHYGKIDGTLSALDKVVRKLVSKGNRLHFVYEAGPCGYQIYRHLTAKGWIVCGGTIQDSQTKWQSDQK
jgi:transposase